MPLLAEDVFGAVVEDMEDFKEIADDRHREISDLKRSTIRKQLTLEWGTERSKNDTG